MTGVLCFFFQAEDGIRDLVRSRGLGDVYKRQILSGSVRRDGSSRFGKANRYAVFPAISAAWNVSGESFFDNIDVISHLKLRASWGQQGNQEIGILSLIHI